MKKAITIFLLLLISTNAFSEELKPRPRMRLKNYNDIQRSANKLRSQKDEIKKYLIEVILRKVKMDLAMVLSEKHFSQEEVKDVMDSTELAGFLEKLGKNPKIQVKIDQHLNNLFKPGILEAEVVRRREMLVKNLQEELMIARNDLQKSKTFLTEEKVLDPEPKSLASKLWDHLIGDLYKGPVE